MIPITIRMTEDSQEDDEDLDEIKGEVKKGGKINALSPSQNPEQQDEFADNNIMDNRTGSRPNRYHSYPASYEEWKKKDGNTHNSRKAFKILIPLNPTHSRIDVHNRNTVKVNLSNWKSRMDKGSGTRGLVDL